MKKISLLKKALAAAAVCLSFSAFAANSAPAQQDDYAEVSDTKTEGDDYDGSAQTGKKTNSSSKTKEKKKSNPFKDFLFGKEKYIYFDSAELATGTIGFGIKPRTAEMILNPDTNMAGTQVYFQSSFFNILFDEKNRALFAGALEQYLDDFENKRLVKGKYLKTRRAYIKNGKCDLEWGTVKIMMDATGSTHFTVGYEFKKRNDKTSPYFCIIIEKCKNTNERTGTYKVDESVEMQLYFTKAQAKQFVKFLSQESINEQLAKYYALENGSGEEESTDAVIDNY